MNKYLKISFLSIFSLLLLGACNGKKTVKEITKNEISKLYKPVVDSIQKGDIVSLIVGFYEENNSEQRLLLRKLAAEGVITYEAEKVLDDNNNPHIFVKVALTKEGSKWIYSPKQTTCAKTAVVSNEDVDMKNRFEKEKHVSDSISNEEDIVVINPTECYDTIVHIVPKPVVPEKPVWALEKVSKELSLYELLSLDVTKDTVQLIGQQRSIFKIRNIICDVTCPNKSCGLFQFFQSKKNKKDVCNDFVASAEVIVENSIVTPFGYVLNGNVKGTKSLNKLSFVFDNESGWILGSPKKNTRSESSENTETEDNNNFEKNNEAQTFNDSMVFSSEELSKKNMISSNIVEVDNNDLEDIEQVYDFISEEI
ncbi:MAG: hypothetical protein MJ197_04860 [Bacteroidales bacterium]|nr:hypothetical protein [Bacteroidales bacterium]